MNNQKVNFIPTYNGVPITNYTPEEGGEFSSDVIDMPEANKAWSMQIAPGFTGNIFVLAGNSLDLDFVEHMDIEVLNDPMIISEPEFNYRYMRLNFKTEGIISLSMVK